MKKGDEVTWKWGRRTAEGKVDQIHEKKITRKIKGSEITRNGSPENKALLIKQEDGTPVLKLESQVHKKK